MPEAGHLGRLGGSDRCRSERRRSAPIERVRHRGRLHPAGPRDDRNGPLRRHGDWAVGRLCRVRRCDRAEEAEGGDDEVNYVTASTSMLGVHSDLEPTCGHPGARGHWDTEVHLHVRELLPSVRRRADRAAQPRSRCPGCSIPVWHEEPGRRPFFDDSLPPARTAAWFRSESSPKGDRRRRARPVRELQLGAVLPRPARRSRCT